MTVSSACSATCSKPVFSNLSLSRTNISLFETARSIQRPFRRFLSSPRAILFVPYSSARPARNMSPPPFPHTNTTAPIGGELFGQICSTCSDIQSPIRMGSRLLLVDLPRRAAIHRSVISRAGVKDLAVQCLRDLTLPLRCHRFEDVGFDLGQRRRPAFQSLHRNPRRKFKSMGFVKNGHSVSSSYDITTPLFTSSWSSGCFRGFGKYANHEAPKHCE